MAFSNTLVSLKGVVTDPVVNISNELAINNNTTVLRPSVSNYFEINHIDDDLVIQFDDIPVSSQSNCYMIYLKLSFDNDNIVIQWPSTIQWYELVPPVISKFENLYVSFITFDKGQTWLSYPLNKVKPLVDLNSYIANAYPSTYASFTEVPLEFLGYLEQIRATSFKNLFNGCTSLQSFMYPDWETSTVTNMLSMFNNCNNLECIDVSNWDVRNVVGTINVTTKANANMDAFSWENPDDAWILSFSRNLNFLIFSDSSFKATGFGSNCRLLVPEDNIATIKESTNWSSYSSQIFKVEDYIITKDIDSLYILPNFDKIRQNYTEYPAYNWAQEFYPTTYSSITQLDSNGLSYLSEVVPIGNCNYMFDGCSSLTSLDLTDLDFSGVTSCTSMFNGVSIPNGVTVTNCKVNNTVASTIGQKASNATAKDLDISIVTNMSNLFNGNTRLIDLDLSDWNTSSVVNTSGMFNNCSNLVSIDLTGLDFTSVTSCSNMLSNVSIPNGVTVTNCKVNNTIASTIGQKASNATAKDLDISEVTNMTTLFKDNTRLISLDLTDWDTSSVTNTTSMFQGCTNLTSLDISGLDFTSVTSCSNMFSDVSIPNGANVTGCKVNSTIASTIGQIASNSSASKIDISLLDNNNLSNLFKGNTRLTAIDLTEWDMSSITNVSSMFQNCSNLTEIDLSGLDLSSVSSDGSIFSGVPSTAEIKLVNSTITPSFILNNLANRYITGLDTVNVVNFTSMNSWYYRGSYTFIDLSGLDTSTVTNIHSLLEDCHVSQSVDFSGLDFRNITDAFRWFDGAQINVLDMRGVKLASSADYGQVGGSATYILADDPNFYRYYNTSYGNSSDLSGLIHTWEKILVPDNLLESYRNQFKQYDYDTGTYYYPVDSISNYNVVKTNGIITVTPK